MEEKSNPYDSVYHHYESKLLLHELAKLKRLNERAAPINQQQAHRHAAVTYTVRKNFEKKS